MIKFIDIFSTCKFFLTVLVLFCHFWIGLFNFFAILIKIASEFYFDIMLKIHGENRELRDQSWGINPNRNFRMFVGSDNVNLFVFVE